LEITAWVAERRWSIRGCESFQGMALIDGTTQDLAQVARAAQAWHDGAALTDISRASPFVHLTGRFEVADHDPVQLAESEWQHLLTEADEVDWPEYRALVEAAYAEPALRGLYPFTSQQPLRSFCADGEFAPERVAGGDMPGPGDRGTGAAQVGTEIDVAADAVQGQDGACNCWLLPLKEKVRHHRQERWVPLVRTISRLRQLRPATSPVIPDGTRSPIHIATMASLSTPWSRI